jgi:hypothetical protein
MEHVRELERSRQLVVLAGSLNELDKLIVERELVGEDLPFARSGEPQCQSSQRHSMWSLSELRWL